MTVLDGSSGCEISTERPRTGAKMRFMGLVWNFCPWTKISHVKSAWRHERLVPARRDSHDSRDGSAAVGDADRRYVILSVSCEMVRPSMSTSGSSSMSVPPKYSTTGMDDSSP